MRAAIAESTRVTYDSALKNFRSFREERGRLRDAPITASEVAMWAAQRADERRLTAATLRTYKAALSTTWIEEAHPDGEQRNPLDSQQVSRVLAGIARVETARGGRRAPPTPLTFTLLQRYAYGDSDREVMLRAAALLGVTASLRTSELLGSPQWPARALSLSQLTFFTDLGCTLRAERIDAVPRVLRLRLLVTKTSTHGCDKIVSVPAAVAHVWRWFLRRRSESEGKPNAKLFLLHGRKLSSLALTGDLERRHAKVRPALPAARFTGKSMRRGGASTLAMQGLDANAIAAQGWAVGSRQWETYANDPEAQLQRAIQINRLMQLPSPGTGAAAAAASSSSSPSVAPPRSSHTHRRR